MGRKRARMRDDFLLCGVTNAPVSILPSSTLVDLLDTQHLQSRPGSVGIYRAIIDGSGKAGRELDGHAPCCCAL